MAASVVSTKWGLPYTPTPAPLQRSLDIFRLKGKKSPPVPAKPGVLRLVPRMTTRGRSSPMFLHRFPDSFHLGLSLKAKCPARGPCCVVGTYFLFALILVVKAGCCPQVQIMLRIKCRALCVPAGPRPLTVSPARISLRPCQVAGGLWHLLCIASAPQKPMQPHSAEFAGKEDGLASAGVFCTPRRLGAWTGSQTGSRRLEPELCHTYLLSTLSRGHRPSGPPFYLRCLDFRSGR